MCLTHEGLSCQRRPRLCKSWNSVPASLLSLPCPASSLSLPALPPPKLAVELGTWLWLCVLLGRSVPSGDGAYFHEECFCWLPLELKQALLAHGVQAPPAESSECPFDHVCKISKYGFKINGACRMGFIMKWPQYSRHQGIPLIGGW